MSVVKIANCKLQIANCKLVAGGLRWEVATEYRELLIGPDGLHMTDRSYACLAYRLAEGLAGNWRAERAVPPPSAARVAGLAGQARAAAPPADPAP